MHAYEHQLELIEENLKHLKADIVKVTDKGVKKACRRSRGNLMNIIKACKEARNIALSIKKEDGEDS